MKVGDLVFDRYHKKYSIVIEAWGSRETGRFVKLNQGYKVAAEYCELINRNLNNSPETAIMEERVR